MDLLFSAANRQIFTLSYYNHAMDHHTVAAVSIVGSCLDVLVPPTLLMTC